MGMPERIHTKILSIMAPSTVEAFATDGEKRLFVGHESYIREAVRRWNAHDGLVEALRGTLDATVAYKARLKKTWDMRVSPGLEEVIDSAIAALEAAKEAE